MLTALLAVLLAAPLAHPLPDGAIAFDRARALALFADPSPLWGQVQGAPLYAETGGWLSVRDLVGIRVWGIRPGTEVHQLGLRDGDVVQRVAGRRVAGLAHLPALAGRVEQAVRAGCPVRVQVLRSGQPLTWLLRPTAPAATPRAASGPSPAAGPAPPRPPSATPPRCPGS
ncbi:MAG: hypothetical protein H6704_25705 [Myxococcales bacterium]|nr:hypothetical protein [Myxococcales bacterium]